MESKVIMVKEGEQSGHALTSLLGPPTRKVRYEKPAISFRAPLEAAAAVCTYASSGKQLGLCHSGPINS